MQQPAANLHTIEPQPGEPTTEAKNAPKKGQSPFQMAFRRFRKNKMALVGIVILILVTLLSVCAPLIASHDPSQADLYNVDAKPDSKHWLGTDDTGRDHFSRLVYGGRISLLIGFFTMLFTVLIGVTFGAVAGYYGGWIDNLLMRLTDLMLNFPFLLFVLFLISIFEKTTIPLLVSALALTSWPTTARIVRGVFLSLREMEYVQSAKAIGCSDWRIIIRHMLPNALGPIIVNATLLMATMISIESALSFLGFGVPEVTPTWGNMLNGAANIRILTQQPWIWIPPGAMIILTVLAINFIGDGLRDAFDTKSTRR
ncbi:oligopeptide ABC transporter permease [Lihuaxuella thermophila]|uniref:Peptide/nickel transport system permease protein n=1 Tax=Lihuaxuella thermophila TaxID=1173111 RepID=A0A1H8HM09_9BACL|nr:oligopeptide ABC transporter permease [Lihuaxuella thermophila]SEN57037.1 peptide/nickel transport system permease protein [Lihuaxuella thermophila]